MIILTIDLQHLKLQFLFFSCLELLDEFQTFEVSCMINTRAARFGYVKLGANS